MNHTTPEKLVLFEEKMAALFEAGELPFLLHLSGGNEISLSWYFENVKDGDWILATHRNHFHYLLSGGSEERLEQLIRDGQSMFVYDRKLNFFTSSIVAGTCAIAVGLAMSLKMSGSSKQVHCFIGDGAVDEGHFWEATRYVDGMGLPCTFIVEDNDRSVNASKAQRWGLFDDLIYLDCVKITPYTPQYPHAGTGTKTWVKFKDWDRFAKA